MRRSEERRPPRAERRRPRGPRHPPGRHTWIPVPACTTVTYGRLMSIVRRLSTAASMALLCSSGAVAIVQPAAAAAPVQVAYGSGAEINTFSGRVRYIVSAPEVVVFHTDEYDAD